MVLLCHVSQYFPSFKASKSLVSILIDFLNASAGEQAKLNLSANTILEGGLTLIYPSELNNTI